MRVHVRKILGTGQGYSVLEMVRAFGAASGRPNPYRLAPRRPGDIATCYLDPTKAERELGWKAQRGLAEMMRDAWRWQQLNPGGMGGRAWGARWRPCAGVGARGCQCHRSHCVRLSGA